MYPNATNYSENFTRRELDCHCGCEAPPAIEAALAGTAAELEKLRVLLNQPIHVNSGYRCPPYNTNIGGALDSQHKKGMAADISVKMRTPAMVAQVANKVDAFHSGGIGIYLGFTHVDRRSNGPARWTG